MIPREEILAWLKKRINEHRFQHTLGVESYAMTLADRFGANVEDAQMAALLHDCAKSMSADDMRPILLAEGYDLTTLENFLPIWHALVGPVVAEKAFGQLQPEVLDAIRYHSTGRPNMTKLEQIIYCADFAEPGRSGYSELSVTRALLKEDLDRATEYTLRVVSEWVETQDQRSVYPLSKEALKYYQELLAHTQA